MKLILAAFLGIVSSIKIKNGDAGLELDNRVLYNSRSYHAKTNDGAWPPFTANLDGHDGAWSYTREAPFNFQGPDSGDD